MLKTLSTGSAYGLLTLVFQHGLGESLGLGSGPIAAWLPLFLFVILFGLSMDYHVFILTRVREAFDRGMALATPWLTGSRARPAWSRARRSSWSRCSRCSRCRRSCRCSKGIGLRTVLIDATIIRGVLLPATMKLLGDWNWYLPRKLGWLPRVTVEPEVQPAAA